MVEGWRRRFAAWILRRRLRKVGLPSADVERFIGYLFADVSRSVSTPSLSESEEPFREDMAGRLGDILKEGERSTSEGTMISILEESLRKGSRHGD